MTKVCAVWILGAVVAVAQPQPSQPAGPKTTVRGRTVDARTGASVRGAQVVVELERRQPAATAHGDHEGRFELEQAPSGTRAITATKSGFEIFRGQVAIPPNGVDDVVIPMNRYAVMTGRVTDENGRPLVGARVRALTRFARDGVTVWRPTGSGRDGASQASTDDRGQYRLWNLPPGSYYVSVAPRVEPGPPGVARLIHRGAFYPGVASREEASKVTLDWGRTLEGVDFVLGRAPETLAAGVVIAEGGGKACENCYGQVHRPTSVGVAGGLFSARPNDDGAMVFEGLTPGRYGVALQSFNRRESSIQHGAAWFDVAEGRTGEFVIEMTGEQPVSGRVVLEDPPPPEKSATEDSQPANRGPRMITVFARGDPSDPLAVRGSRGGNARVPPEGPYEFEMTVGPGASRINVYMPDRNGYLRSVRLEGRDLGTNRIEVPRGGLKNLELVIAFDDGSVTGRVTEREDSGDSKGPLLPGPPLVRLLPLGQSGRDFGDERGARADVEGAFTVQGVPPGRYVAYALPPSPGYPIEDPEIQAKLRGYGKTVEVRAGQATDVTLTTAPRFDELR